MKQPVPPVRLECTATLHVSLDDPVPPQIVDVRVRTAKFKRRLWIPQTLYQQVWIRYEFDTPEQKAEFLAGVPEDLRFAIATHLTQEHLDMWS